MATKIDAPYNAPKPRDLSTDPNSGAKMPDGTVYVCVSPSTNKPMYATPSDAPLTMTFNDAADHAAKLDVHGHKDWRVPSQAELNLMSNNLVAIGGFNVSISNPVGMYWSASQEVDWAGWCQRLSDGGQFYGDKASHYSFRCVRDDMAPDKLLIPPKLAQAAALAAIPVSTRATQDRKPAKLNL